MNIFPKDIREFTTLATENCTLCIGLHENLSNKNVTKMRTSKYLFL